jgi:octaprenyl-diphosphate synthase
LNTAPESVSESMLSIIKTQNYTPENILKLTCFAKEYRGIEYAESYMQRIKNKIIALLNKYPDSESKTAMIDLIDYVIEREH